MLPEVNFTKMLPEVSFSVSDKDDVFRYNSFFNKVARVAWLLFSIILFPVGLIRLYGKAINHIATKKFFVPGVSIDKAMLDSKRSEIMALPFFVENCERVIIKTADRVKLDTLIINNPDQKEKDVADHRYIIFFNGNTNTYEEMFSSLKKLSETTGASVYSGNYRGVGCSEGWPTKFQDIVMDGEAMVQYLLSKGVQKKNILIHGWSLGGGVGAHVSAHHQEPGQEISYCGDRTFASLVAVAQEWFCPDSIKELLPEKFQAEFYSNCISKIMTLGAVNLLHLLNWNFKTLECYKKINGYKFIIYLPNDNVIPHKASLYKKFKDSQMKHHPKRVRLSEKHTHAQPIDVTLEFEIYKTHVATAFESS